ncbi:MAG: hypothetical protein JST11_29455 [Acidobacteria bacterium]|nr:hypothetical protein [Acidobacteriota bacterium]
MSDLLWRKLKEVKVPEVAKAAAAPGTAWTIGLDFVAPKRLYRLQLVSGRWKLKEQAADCAADGYPRTVTRGAALLAPDAPVGCLLAKVGGSTADNAGLIFAAGRYCVFQVEEAKAGPLYLGTNDVAAFMDEVENQLTVEIAVAF